MRRMTALALSALLTLGVAGVAAADTITETLTITSAMSMTGVPASIDYGSFAPGTPSAEQSFGVTVNSNVNWRVDFDGSDFTGPGSLTKGARELKITPGSLAGGNVAAFTSFTALQSGQPEIFGDAATGATATAALRINAPSSTVPGAYTGTVTVTLSAS